jgi:Ca-activated chloride channel family protein
MKNTRRPHSVSGSHRIRAGLLCLGFFLCAHNVVRAEATSAADYFNLGSSTFIREDPERALAIVNEGLMFHPDDEPLLRLKALLEQKKDQEQQQQQQEQQQEQNDSSKDDSDSSEKPDDSSEQGDQNQDQNEPEKPEEQSPEEEQPQEPSEQAPEPTAGEMTEEEAEMVLDSLRQLEQAQREQLMQEMIRRQMQNMPPVEKDW